MVYLGASLRATTKGRVTPRAETSRGRRGGAVPSRASSERGEGGRPERGRAAPRAAAPPRTAAATAGEPCRFRARASVRCGENGRVSPGNPRLSSARDTASASATSASRPAPQPTQTTFAGPRGGKHPMPSSSRSKRRHARGRRARRAADVLHAVVGKLVEETKRQVALGGGHPPELAFGKADVPRARVTRRAPDRERRRRGRRGSTSSLLSPRLLSPRLLLVGLGEKPPLRAGLAAERRVSRADRAVPAEVLEAVRALLDEKPLEHLLALLAEEIRRVVFVFLAPAHGGMIGPAGRLVAAGGIEPPTKGL